MKNKTPMIHKDTIFLTSVMAILTGTLSAQEDSIKYQNLSVHKIVNGRQTADSYVTGQKTFSMDDRLIREVNFDDSTKKIHDYTFYFYRDGKLFTEENHDKSDSLRHIIMHKYNAKGKEEEISRLEWRNGKMMETGKTTFLYDETGKIISKKEFTTRKKLYRITSYLYSSGNLAKEHCKAKKPPDNIILRTFDYQYQPDGKPALKKILEKNTDKSIGNSSEVYRYNDVGMLKQVEILDSDGQIALIKNYEYFANGRLSRYYEQNREGEMLCYHSYAYRQHKINLGNQKSYFDNPGLN